MGAAYRRFTENFKQKTAIGRLADRHFVATSRERSVIMLKEASEFGVHLRRMEKEIKSSQASVESLLDVTREVAGAPLPHVYEETAVGSGGAVKPVESVGGPRFSNEGFSMAKLELSRRMEAEVLGPLQRWRAAHDHLTERSREVERMRLDADSRRRRVSELASSVDSQRSKMDTSKGGSSKAQAQLEALAQKLHRKQEKLGVATEAYTQAETELHSQLSALIRDAAWLRNFMAAALSITGSAMTAASAAMGASQTASPAPPVVATTVTTAAATATSNPLFDRGSPSSGPASPSPVTPTVAAQRSAAHGSNPISPIV